MNKEKLEHGAVFAFLAAFSALCLPSLPFLVPQCTPASPCTPPKPSNLNLTWGWGSLLLVFVYVYPPSVRVRAKPRPCLD